MHNFHIIRDFIKDMFLYGQIYVCNFILYFSQNKYNHQYEANQMMHAAVTLTVVVHYVVWSVRLRRAAMNGIVCCLRIDIVNVYVRSALWLSCIGVISHFIITFVITRSIFILEFHSGNWSQITSLSIIIFAG